jgi:membrane protease YdiL (CAAX protease family)
VTDQQPTESAWRRFWNRGGWWKALSVVVVYYALYQGLSLLLVGPLYTAVAPEEGSPAFILLTTALPIAIGCVLLVVFALSLGWLKELFGPQPIRGSWWMWIAVAAVLVFNVIHLITLDYGKAGAGVVAAWLFTGLFIGFAEETLTRGFAVNLLRKAGYREFVVALLSSLLFAALHAGNLFTTDQGPLATGFQVIYTFFFGVCMYLTLRVTGNLIWPILLHASTDPTIFLSAQYPTEGALATIGAQGNFVVIFAGLILIWFVRGRVKPKDEFAVDPKLA